MSRRELIIKDTHRGLWYEDGVLTQVLGAGRYVLPRHVDLGFYRRPKVEVVLVDARERDLTIKGQEILTSDKVAIRVSIVVQFQVTDPAAALHKVNSYEERLYTDVQLAARRSLASMTLEDILTNRNRLSEDILADVKEVAATYGVTIFRADMNRVLAAERMSQVQMVEARTKAEIQRMDAQVLAEGERAAAEARSAAQRLQAEAAADIQRIATQAEIEALRQREAGADAYAAHPSLLRLAELETLRQLASSANARIYVDFDRHRPNEE